MKRARFWAYVAGGPVKITLAPGETRTHSHGGPTEEGWSSHTETWSYEEDEGIVVREAVDDGRDCDGRISAYGTQECPVGLLAAGYRDTEFGVTYPDWQCVSASQRDYAAEAAGY